MADILAASIIGILALCALIWLVFPIVAVGDVRPFASVWLRMALIVLVLASFFGFHAWRFYKKRKASAAIKVKLAGEYFPGTGLGRPAAFRKNGRRASNLYASRKNRGAIFFMSCRGTSSSARRARARPPRWSIPD